VPESHRRIPKSIRQQTKRFIKSTLFQEKKLNKQIQNNNNNKSTQRPFMPSFVATTTTTTTTTAKKKKKEGVVFETDRR